MIGFLDSGIGGISVLNFCKNVLGGQKVVYLCDDKNMPYGSKTKRQICKITVKNVKKLVKIGCATIVLACNTATATSIGFLRKKFKSIDFVGTEPNITEPKRDGLKNVLVLCTPATALNCKILQNLDERFVVFACRDLATLIENKQDISRCFDGLDKDQFDGVVLGCTHYVFAIEALKAIFKNAKFYNSLFGIRKQLEKILQEPKILTTSKNKQKQNLIKNLLTK